MAAGSPVHPDGPNDPLPLNMRTADLPKRLLSAVVMLAVVALAVCIGGLALDALIVAVALVAFLEFAFLVVRATPNLLVRLLGWAAGALYFGTAAMILAGAGTFLLVMVVGITVFTDTGAYFTGRAIGGPKIAPSISPSIRSNTPPWPGLSRELSLTPALRLSQLSKKSPICATTASPAPSATAPVTLRGERLRPTSKRGQPSGASIAQTHRNTQITDAAIPPNSPAQVFDGLMLGAILGPPIARPVK